MKRFPLFACFVALCAIQVWAAEPAEDEISIQILSNLAKARPDVRYGEVTTSPVAGLYRVQVVDGPVLYVSADGEYFISGDLYQVLPGRFVNLTEIELNGKRKTLLAEVKRNDMVIFSPPGKVKAVVNVFTDVDCGYCRKFHQQVPALNDLGVEVRYLAFPRAGIHSASYRKIVSAWCSDDPKTALTQLKNGVAVIENLCANNPVAEEYRLGQEMGVTGTPAMVLADGTLLMGYRDTEELTNLLGI